MATQLIGQSVPNYRNAARFVSGRGQYLDDVNCEGQAWARIVRSDVAHGIVRKINVDTAISMPGVIAIYTAQDMGDLITGIPQRVVALPGMDDFVQPTIATTRVRYVGEPVAVVIAENPYLAEDAAEAVELSIDPLPVVIEAKDSLKDKVLLHPDNNTNSASAYEVGYGDIDYAFKNAYLVVEEDFHIHRHGATPLECRGLLAQWDQNTQHMTVWGAAKVPFANRKILADMLGLAAEQVDMLVCDVGGSFGVRGDFYPEDFLIPFASKKLNRPIKWLEDRAENLVALNHSRETDCKLAIAFSKEGHMLGMRGSMIVDHGAYIRTNTGVMLGKGIQFLSGPYAIEAVHFSGHSVCTNKTPAGTYRGPGRYESTFFRERLIDIAAKKLKLNAIEIRKLNFIQPHQFPYDAGALVPGMSATVFDNGNYAEVLDIALKEFDWDKRVQQNGQLIDGKYIGLGLGCFVESTGGGPGEHVRLTLRNDGLFDLAIGAASAGQNHDLAMAQVLADTLDVSFDKIRVFHGSTNLLSQGFGAYHSRSAVMCGNATAIAGQKMKNELLRHAAQILKCDASTLEWKGGTVIDQNGTVQLTIETLAETQTPHYTPADRGELEVTAEFMCDKLTYTFGVQCAQVAVDPLTAKVEVLDYYCTEDVGRIINPDVVHGQTIGAAVQGLGGTFLDEFIYDKTGQLLTGTFADYLLPTSTDFPFIRGHTLSINYSPHNPLGIKGAGEGGIIATGAAISNAVSSALQTLNVSITALPVSMKNLSRLIRYKRESKGKKGMDIQGEHILYASRQKVWQTLMSPDALKASIPGCIDIHETSHNHYDIKVKSSVGLVSFTMNAQMEITDIVPDKSYCLIISGNAGAAGFATGKVNIQLHDEESSNTKITYQANGEIGGRLARVGARLVDGVIARMTDQFFENFQKIINKNDVDTAHRLTAATNHYKDKSENNYGLKIMLPWLISAASLGSTVTMILIYALKG